MNRYILIDPTGINLAVEPVREPISLEAGSLATSSTTVTGVQVTGAAEMRYNFGFECHLTKPEADALTALARQQERTGRETEVVAYYAWDTHTDLEVQTRENVPGVLPTSEDGFVTYYPVVQGDLAVTTELIGHRQGQPYYRCSVNFIEGTIRRPTAT